MLSIDDDPRFTYLLTRLCYDQMKNSLNETINFSASTTVKSDYYVNTLSKYSQNTMIICGEHKALFVDVDTLDQLKAVTINKDVQDPT